jgi:uncharacterized membrane protein YjjB (DUF3815 family)
MLSRQLKVIGISAAIAVAAVTALLSFESPLISGLLALACVALLGHAWKRAGRARSEVLNDYAASTLVFPPESKFPQSVFPRR